MSRALPLILATLVTMGTLAAPAPDKLRLISGQEPRHVFGGDMRTITLTWHNPGQNTFTGTVTARLYQTSSGTAAPLGTAAWKTLTILPGQTVLESAGLRLPVVRSQTRFVIQWLAPGNQVLGSSEVWVYPTNLLQQFQVLAGEQPMGVLDPQNRLKPVLKSAAVQICELSRDQLKECSGKLVIAGPFANDAQMGNGLAAELQALAKEGAGIVWLVPSRNQEAWREAPLRPEFYTVREGKGAVVVAQDRLVARFPEDPLAQLTLLQLARLALNPEAPRLPDPTL